MARRTDIVDSEQNREGTAPARSLLAPPAGTIEGIRAIFWNQRELRAGWRLLIFVGLFIATGAAISFFALFLHLPYATATNVTASGLLVQEILLLFAVMAATAFLGVLESRRTGDYGLPITAAFGARFWHGIVWGLAMISGMILLIRLLGGFSFGQMALHGPAIWGYATLWGLVFLCVGLFEELTFRGYAQFTLAAGIGFWPAATILSALFGALHLTNRGEDKIGALSVFVMGMFLCFTLRRTGNLWFAVGLHTSFDWGETFLFSTPNSGVVVSGHLLNSSFHGAVWLTGGPVGPEGSVMAFVVVALAGAFFSPVYPPRDEH